MKNPLLLCLFFLSSFCLAQNYEVTYSVSVAKPDTLTRANLLFYQNTHQVAEHLTYKLLVSGHKSYFKPETDEHWKEKYDQALTFFGKHIYLTDSKKRVWTIEYHFGDEKRYKQKKIDSVPWKISTSDKEILGYKVKKAEAIFPMPYRDLSEQKVEIWFAPELKTSAGIQKYIGLPGLILKIKRGMLSYTAEQVKEPSQVVLPKLQGNKHPWSKNIRIFKRKPSFGEVMELLFGRGPGK